jgi:plasmid segregation protein ParM
MIVRSVDVGYGNTKFVERVLPNGSIGCAHFPSIACISAKGAKKRAVGGARRTMELEIDGVVYEVGQDVNLVTGTFQSKRMDDKYFESPEYLALLRGAVSQMNVDRIDILVLGLPVAAFKLRTAAVYLQKHFSGKHPC